MALLCGGGGGDGGDPVSAEDAKANKDADKAMNQKVVEDKKIVKMLLLGAGESGKSTIFKQMKVINQDGYSTEERQAFQSIVWSNVIVSIKSLLSAFEKLEIEMPADIKKIFDDIEEKTADAETVTPEIGAWIKTAWGNDKVQECFGRRNEFQLNDSAEYYFLAIDRIADPKYLPTTDDVLRSRVRTTGIVQSDFKIKATNFSMFDVGGQRNERRKWIHCFDHVNALVFVAALSEFDQVLYEDESQNRLDEAIDLFAQIVNSKWFANTSFILFLNKKDLFEKKLKDKKFADFRKEYEGPNTMEDTSKYCKELFLKQRKNTEKNVFTHITTATDTENVRFVFNAVVAIILDENMKASGLM